MTSINELLSTHSITAVRSYGMPYELTSNASFAKPITIWNSLNQLRSNMCDEDKSNPPTSKGPLNGTTQWQLI